MREELKRRESESHLSYAKRVTEMKKELDLDYAEWGKLVCGKEYSSENARKAFYILKPFLDMVDVEQVENIEDNQILNELEMMKIEIEKEKIRFQDQRREFKNLVRPEARFERILEVMEREIKSINNIKPFLSKRVDTYRSSNNEAVLIASDWHIGTKFKNYFGEYSIDIAKRRLNDLLNSTVEYCEANKVDTLHLELLGDNISGGIHWSSKVDGEEDCVSQTMRLCELLSEFIVKLSENIPNVKVYSVVGNHSRINMNKKDNQKGENLERFVPFYLKTRLVNVNNVQIMEECNIDDGIIVFKVLNTEIVGVHGDLDKPNQIINNMIKMFRRVSDEYHMGHLHHHFEKEEHDIEVVINGSLQGTDDYAKDIRKSGRPMQKLMIYNEEGKFATYKIKLN